MTTLPTPGPLDGPSRAGATRPSQAAEPQRGPAFRARLAELQDQAASLAERSLEADRPEALRAAVDSARAALEGAESLGSELLEAFRAGARAQGASQAATPAASRPEPDVEPGP